MGSKGLDLFGQTNLNEVAPANRLAYAQTGNQALRPLNGTASIGDGNLAMWQHNRDSIYHSLQVAFASRFGNNSVLAASYTWAKLISNTGVGNADGPGLSYNNAYIDSTQPDLDRARGANDRTHSFNASLVLGLPKFEDKGAFVKNVFGDWEFTSIVQAGTGYPITVNIGSVPGLDGNGVPRAPGSGGDRVAAERGRGQSCTADGSNPTQWLNPDAWTLNGYQIGTIGNSGRNICEGPGLFQVDASVYKNIRLAGG